MRLDSGIRPTGRWEPCTDSIAASLDERAARLSTDADEAADGAQLAIVGGGLIAIALAVLMGVLATRSIVRPLSRVGAAVDRVAEGDLTAASEVDQRDETGQLAASFEREMVALRAMVGTMAESATTVAATQIESTSTAIAGSELAQETARATEDIARRVAVIQTDTTGAVEAIEQIAGVVARISDSQTTIAAAVEEQTLTTQEMNRNVSDAATASGEIASTIGGVAGAAPTTTEGVQDLHAVVGELSRTSTRLQEQVGGFRYE